MSRVFAIPLPVFGIEDSVTMRAEVPRMPSDVVALAIRRIVTFPPAVLSHVTVYDAHGRHRSTTEPLDYARRTGPMELHGEHGQFHRQAYPILHDGDTVEVILREIERDTRADGKVAATAMCYSVLERTVTP